MSVIKPIHTDRFAAQLRERSIDLVGRRILISRFTGSGQEVDFALPATCNGYGRVHHFRCEEDELWPANPLPILPACRALGITPVPHLMTALVFQNAACAWRCWYCFVPEELLTADLNRSAWFTSAELIKLYSQVPDAPLIIDLSGGSPDSAGMDAVDDAGAHKRWACRQRAERADFAVTGLLLGIEA
jgi:hypothetical protein